MRTQGSLRLILNTKLWAQMQIDKASEKSIRITAMDTEDQGVKVFLISVSSPGDGTGYYQPLGEKKCVNRPLDKGRALLSSHRREVPRAHPVGPLWGCIKDCPSRGGALWCSGRHSALRVWAREQRASQFANRSVEERSEPASPSAIPAASFVSPWEGRALGHQELRPAVPELAEERGLGSSPGTAPGTTASHHRKAAAALTKSTSLCLSQASSKDTGQLYAALHHRILALRSRVEQEQEAKMPAPEPGAAPSNEDDSDEDVLAPSGATGGGEAVVLALEGMGSLTRGWASARVGT